MAIAGITRQGLASMAVSVAVLWGCFLGERVIVRQAVAEQARALHTIDSLRFHQLHDQPVSAPVPQIPHPFRPAVG